MAGVTDKLLVLVCLQMASVLVSCWAKKEIAASSVGCFTCQSFNGSDTGCEDPFHPAYANYDRECKQGMRGRVGLFLASFCIKMAGSQLANGDTIMVRTCSLENMGHQCGIFEFEEKLYHGCLTTCIEDACNSTPPYYTVKHNITIGSLLITTLLTIYSSSCFTVLGGV